MIAAASLCLVGFLPSGSFQREPVPCPPLVFVRAEAGFVPLAELDQPNGTSLLIPLHSRSERVRRADAAGGIVTIRIFGGTAGVPVVNCVKLFAIPHRIDERVLFVREGQTEAARLVGPTQLPSELVDATSGEDLLPVLARQDGCAVEQRALRVTAPKVTSATVLLGIGRDDHPARWLSLLDMAHPGPVVDGIRGTHVVATHDRAIGLPTSGEQVVQIEAGALDQLGFVTTSEITRRDSVRLAKVSAGEGRRIGASPFCGDGDAWPDLAFAPEAAADSSDAVRDDLAELDSRFVAIEPGRFVELVFAAPEATPDRSWTLQMSIDCAKLDPATGRRTSGGSQVDRASVDVERKTSPHFRDVARDVGVSMVHFEGPDLQLDIRPTMGPGCAWGDVDGDGWVDLFLPQGGGREGSTPPRARMFRNVEGKRIADITAPSKLDLVGAGMGALFFDFEGDGDLDLFVANYGVNTLRLNDGKGVFSDATTLLGPNPSRWNAAVSASDYDRDGDLDLYVTSYLLYDVAQIPPAEELGRYQREDPLEMIPFAFPGEVKSLLRNDLVDGSRAFHDVAKELGLDDPMGRGMQALWWDFDRDGDEDLYLANDVSPNRIWRNEGDGKFKDIGMSTGLDDPRGCMGLAAGDIDGDLDEDLVVTNWQLESNALYVNNLRHTSARSRVSTFRDRAVEAGLGQLSVGVTGWGCELADFDLDGDLDLFIANGYTSPDYESTGICVGQPCHYFENDGTGKFTAAFEKAGPDVAVPLASRASSACDFDQDGDLDLVVTANNGRVRLLRNELAHEKRHWLGLRLRGKGANTRAIGAQVEVTVGETKLLRTLRAGTSYLAGNPPELHFGLGEATKIDACSIRWSSGQTTTHAIDAVDRFVTLEEP